MHQITNVTVATVDGGNTASARCYFTVLQVTPQGLHPTLVGEYRDRFARVDGEWRFTERVFVAEAVRRHVATHAIVNALERHPIDIVRVVIGLLIVGGLGAVVQWSGVTDLERDAFQIVNDLPAWIGPPLEAVMQIGTLTAVAIVCGVALVFRKWRLALVLALAGAGAWWAARIAKEIVDRGRPLDFLNDVVVRGPRYESYGYPSAHCAVAAALVTVSAPYLPRAWRRVAWGAVFATGIARMFVGAHFPLDVVGGIALGWSVGAFVNLVIGTPCRLPIIPGYLAFRSLAKRELL